MLASGLRKRKKRQRALQPCFSRYAVSHCEALHRRLGNSPFWLCFQKHHMRTMIIQTVKHKVWNRFWRLID